MTKERHYTPPIVLRVRFNEARHRWKARFVLANLFYLVVIGGLGVSLIQSNFGQPGHLEIMAQVNGNLAFFWRDSGPDLRWNGPQYLRL